MVLWNPVYLHWPSFWNRGTSRLWISICGQYQKWRHSPSFGEISSHFAGFQWLRPRLLTHSSTLQSVSSSTSVPFHKVKQPHAIYTKHISILFPVRNFIRALCSPTNKTQVSNGAYTVSRWAAVCNSWSIPSFVSYILQATPREAVLFSCCWWSNFSLHEACNGHEITDSSFTWGFTCPQTNYLSSAGNSSFIIWEPKNGVKTGL